MNLDPHTILQGLLYSYCIYAIVFRIARNSNKKPQIAAILGISIAALSWIPFEPHFAGIARGAFSDLSAASVVIATVFLLQPNKEQEHAHFRNLQPLSLAIIILGIFLFGNYIGVLPLGNFAVYASGYTSALLPILFGALALLAIWKSWSWMASWILLGFLIHFSELHTTRNLWHSFVDFPAWVLFLLTFVRNLLKQRHTKQSLSATKRPA